jgi:hypothetical protein
MCFSAAASSENDHGSINLASKIAPPFRQGLPPSTGAPDVAADAGRIRPLGCTNAG